MAEAAFKRDRSHTAADRQVSKGKTSERYSRPTRPGFIAATLKGSAWWPGGVFPADEAGLHCGTLVIVLPDTMMLGCSRPTRPGFIAAPAAPSPRRADPGVFPADEAGLHCGRRSRS